MIVLSQILRGDLELLPSVFYLQPIHLISGKLKIIDNAQCMVYYSNGCYMTYRVNDKTCTGCGSCQDICPADAIQLVKGKAVITIECIDCGACPRVCPEGAIRQELSTTIQNTR